MVKIGCCSDNAVFFIFLVEKYFLHCYLLLCDVVVQELIVIEYLACYCVHIYVKIEQ